MKLSKFISICTFVTMFSLLYVYQQTEVYRLAYLGQKRQVMCQDLLDKNTILRYNINRNASLVNINSKFSGTGDFQMPDSYQMVRMRASRKGLQLASAAGNKENFFGRIFSIKRQAEAKTINP